MEEVVGAKQQVRPMRKAGNKLETALWAWLRPRNMTFIMKAMRSY